MTLKVIETFSGIGAQAKALERIKNRNRNFDYEIVTTVEWEIGAMYAYDIIHNGKQNLSKYDSFGKKELFDLLKGYNLSSDGKTPMSKKSLKRLSLKQMKAIFHSIEKNKNYVDISTVKAEDLPDADLLTYSFPCQDLSISSFWHKNFSGINKDSNNRSSLLWQIERILKEYEIIDKKKPRFLLMENVTAIQSPLHKDNFILWQNELEDMGYISFPINLNAKDFGVPQNRIRTYMLSVLYEDHRAEIIEFMELSDLYSSVAYPSMEDFLCLDYSNPTYLAEATVSTPNYTPSRISIHRDSVILANGDQLTGNMAKTITTKQDRNPNAGIINHQLKLSEGKAPYRNITPRESFLLMGFDESDFDKLIENNIKISKSRNILSHSKLLKLAGNSIVVNVIEQIFSNIVQIDKLFSPLQKETATQKK